MTQRPSRLRVALELRAMPELMGFFASAPALWSMLPRGKGRPVLVMPGFMAGDASTRPLRTLLRALGHNAVGWELGSNLGPTNGILEGMIDLLDRLDKEDGPVDIIGWSLGGIYGREMARLAPSAVRQVITLGSPFQISDSSESNVGPMFHALQRAHSDQIMVPRIADHAREAIPVPTTSVYSRSDGIVRWKQCLDPQQPLSENIEVRGSHCGLGHNPAAVMVIADRLAHVTGQWQPYTPPAAAQGLFPEPVHYVA